MILILSERKDITTYHIAKWLEYYGKEVFILTDEDKIKMLCINNNGISFEVDDYILNFKEIEAYWYRRGIFNLPFSINSEGLPNAIIDNLKKERALVNEILHTYLLKIPNLSSIFNSDLNRVNVLYKAKDAELQIPNFGIFNCKKDIEGFFSKYSKIITKPIWNGISTIENNTLFINYTAEFTQEDLAGLPELFAPSLFIEYIEKKYELRIFYLNGECYTIAILSQNDPKTQLDYRKYNNEKPNRNVSYLLPKNIEDKIRRLMENVNLKTGSIDIIVTPEDDFVLLEINPIGQFLNVSQDCNYNIEKNIALYLSNIAQ